MFYKHLHDPSCDLFMHGEEAPQAKEAQLQAALDAEREKVAKLEAALDAAQGESTRWFRAARLQREAGRDLRALVRGLPIYEADALITVDGDLDEIDRPALRSAVMELLAYRATLDATTPAVCPDCDGDGAVDSGGTDPNGNPLMRRCGCREKGGDGE